MYWWIWLKHSRSDFYLPNFIFPYVEQNFFSQIAPMPALSHHLVGSGKTQQKNQKTGHRSKTSKRESSKGKWDIESHQNKQKTPVVAILTSNNWSSTTKLKNAIDLLSFILTQTLLIATKQAKINVLHAKLKLDNLIVLKMEDLVAYKKQRCNDIRSIIFGFVLKKA